MRFAISTPQTVERSIAKQKSRKASKRKSANGSDIEPSTKKQEVLDASLPLRPAQPDTHAVTITSSTEEPMKLVNASLPLAEAQARNTTDLGPTTEEQKSDDGSVGLSAAQNTESCRLSIQDPELDQGSLPPNYAPVHKITDHEPAPKKQKLSFASLPRARARKTLSSEDLERIDEYHCRKRLECWCRRYGFDDQIISRISDGLLRSPTWDIYQFIHEQSSRPLTDTYGAMELDIYRRGGNLFLCDQTYIPQSSMMSPFRSPTHNSSAPVMAYSTISATPDRNVSIRSDCAKVDNTASSAASNHLLPLSRGRFSRDETSVASSSQISAVEPVRKKGGRPKGRKPRAPRKPKTPKGRTRFQKNHPVKAAVHFDVWENILSFCPPDFLLKARTISSTFRSMLKDDSAIWKISRVSHFGSDMPEPPVGLSEPQYTDLLTGTGCQTRGCESQKVRKTYWALQKRLCVECFNKSFVPPRALRRIVEELEMSETPQYCSIALEYRRMEDFLPAMKFDRWDNYQWLGNYDPKPSWGNLWRSGQYAGFPASAYAAFTSELAGLVGNEYDEEKGRFASNKPLLGKSCPPQDAIDAWFESKFAANEALVLELQAVENWHETYKRKVQKTGKDIKKSRESFLAEQAELAGFDKEFLHKCDSYKAAIAISRPGTMMAWKILLPKLTAERESMERTVAEGNVEREAEMERTEAESERLGEAELEPEIEFEEEVERELQLLLQEEEEREWTAELENEADYMMAGLWKSDVPMSGGGNETDRGTD